MRLAGDVGMAEIGLSEAIAAVRAELAAAVEQGVDAELQFPVDGVELEFQVGVTWEGQTGERFASGCWSGVRRAAASGSRETQ